MSVDLPFWLTDTHTTNTLRLRGALRDKRPPDYGAKLGFFGPGLGPVKREMFIYHRHSSSSIASPSHTVSFCSELCMHIGPLPNSSPVRLRLHIKLEYFSLLATQLSSSFDAKSQAATCRSGLHQSRNYFLESLHS